MYVIGGVYIRMPGPEGMQRQWTSHFESSLNPNSVAGNKGVQCLASDDPSQRGLIDSKIEVLDSGASVEIGQRDKLAPIDSPRP